MAEEKDELHPPPPAIVAPQGEEKETIKDPKEDEKDEDEDEDED